MHYSFMFRRSSIYRNSYSSANIKSSFRKALVSFLIKDCLTVRLPCSNRTCICVYFFVAVVVVHFLSLFRKVIAFH